MIFVFRTSIASDRLHRPARQLSTSLTSDENHFWKNFGGSDQIGVRPYHDTLLVTLDY